MPVRTSEATWKGDLPHGSGDMTVGDGLFRGTYSFVSRFQEGEGTNPEELLAAAHAGYHAMALSNGLAEDGFEPERVHAVAAVHLDDGEISRIDLDVDADVLDVDEAAFLAAAETTKETLHGLAGAGGRPEITLDATLG